DDALVCRSNPCKGPFVGARCAHARNDMIPASDGLLNFDAQVGKCMENHFNVLPYAFAPTDRARGKLRLSLVGIVDAAEVLIKIAGVQSSDLLLCKADVFLFCHSGHSFLIACEYTPTGVSPQG